MRNLKGKVTILLIVALVLFLFLSALIVADGLLDELGPADVGIVFGNRVQPNGEPSSKLKARLDKAIQLYSKSYFDKIIVSGGLGREGFIEAQVMKDYLISQGIPEKNILADDNGMDTYQSVMNSKEIMADNNLSSALVISQYFHISRIKLACKRFGLEHIYSAHAEYYNLRDFYSIFREVIAYGYYLVRSYL